MSKLSDNTDLKYTENDLASDLSQDLEEEESVSEFLFMLNDVYDHLADLEKRISALNDRCLDSSNVTLESRLFRIERIISLFCTFASLCSFVFFYEYTKLCFSAIFPRIFDENGILVGPIPR